MRRICVFTAARSEFGQLLGLMRCIADDPELELRLLVSGAHLSAAHGHTVDEIIAAGFRPDEEIEILSPGDGPADVCAAMGRAMTGYGPALLRMRPDIFLVLGDRYETLCAAAAAQVCRIPLAHVHGGETTLGAMDDAFRHAITKLAHLHFTACAAYRRRVIQMGEPPDRVYDVGALALDGIHEEPTRSPSELGREIGFDLSEGYLVVTFHPATLDPTPAEVQFAELLAALDTFPLRRVLFTKANADPQGRRINDMIDRYVARDPSRCHGVASLGRTRYLSAVRGAAAVVGNSSSGMLEAPALGTPSVNIGSRQEGRLRVPGIIDCVPSAAAIAAAIRRALDPGLRETMRGRRHPCDQPGTARRIVEVLRSVDITGLLRKPFHDWEGGLYE